MCAIQSRNLSPFTLHAINYVHNTLILCMLVYSAPLRAIIAIPYCYMYHSTKWYWHNSGTGVCGFSSIYLNEEAAYKRVCPREVRRKKMAVTLYSSG